jgi:hypothetical protein
VKDGFRYDEMGIDANQNKASNKIRISWSLCNIYELAGYDFSNPLFTYEYSETIAIGAN